MLDYINKMIFLTLQDTSMLDTLTNNSRQQVKPVKIDKAILERYMFLDREINQCEGHNVLKNIEVKKDQTNDLEGTIQQLALHYQQCVQTS